MQLQARLVHADGQRRVVLVTAREGDRLLGSALGEATGAEEAEDRALTRLLSRLGGTPEQVEPIRRTPAPLPARLPPIDSIDSIEPIGADEDVPLPAAGDSMVPTELLAAPAGPFLSPALSPAPDPEPAPPEPPVDPEDWSAELSQLDLQLRRLGWSREQEAIYLQRAFGHPSRNRLTTYADLIAYLRALEGFAPEVDPATTSVPLRRGDLLSQCDQLLEGLGWGAEQGREFLQRHLGAASRQQLSDQQLLQFNMLLEEKLISATSSLAPQSL